jgi:hypothetical protein
MTVFDTTWVAICRQALRAGLTKEQSRNITRQSLIAAATELVKAEHGMTVEAFCRLLWSWARRYVAAAVGKKVNLQPFYASVAWREEHVPPPELD